MKEVFRDSSPARVGLYQSVIVSAGFHCFVRNEIMQQAIPGGVLVAFLPLPDFWPTLCVINDEDYPTAIELLRVPRESIPPADGDWKCAACRETVPANFTSCWNCETERDVAR